MITYKPPLYSYARGARACAPRAFSRAMATPEPEDEPPDELPPISAFASIPEAASPMPTDVPELGGGQLNLLASAVRDIVEAAQRATDGRYRDARCGGDVLNRDAANVGHAASVAQASVRSQFSPSHGRIPGTLSLHTGRGAAR